MISPYSIVPSSFQQSEQKNEEMPKNDYSEDEVTTSFSQNYWTAPFYRSSTQKSTREESKIEEIAAQKYSTPQQVSEQDDLSTSQNIYYSACSFELESPHMKQPPYVPPLGNL